MKLLKVLLITMVAVVLAFAQQPSSDPDAAKKQAEEEERTSTKFIEGICSTCHDAQLITDTRATKDEWLDILKNMNGKGAGLSEQDVELMANYLSKKYGPEK
jgi:cytochrome c553